MDKYLVSLAFLLLLLEGSWLAYDIDYSSRKQDQSLNSAPLGKFIKLKHQVRKRGADSLVWEQTDKEQNIFAYDSILTLGQSTAEIVLQGDSRISMNENTMIVVEPPDEKNTNGPLRLRFKKGNLRTIAGGNPQSVESGDFVVEATSQTQMNIRSTTEGEFEVETIKGEVKLLDGKTMEVKDIVNTGQSAQIKAEKINKNTSAKDLSWKTPLDGEKIYTHDVSANVNFSWEGNATEIDLGKEKKLLQKDQQSWVEPLSVGNYIVRLNKQGESSFARVISVWNAPKIYLITPIVRQRFKKSMPIHFVWTQTPSVAKYILEVSTDSKFKNIVKSEVTTGTHSTFTQLPEGELHWRVRGQDESGFEIPELYENIFFTKDKLLEAPKLKIPQIEEESSQIKIKNYFERFWRLLLPSANAEETRSYSAEFQWEKLEGATGYEIEISQTSDFRNIIVVGHPYTESYKWKNFPLGKYYWRVAGRDSSGDTGIFSEAAYADLTKIPTKVITPHAPPHAIQNKAEAIPSAPVSPAPPAKEEILETWNFSFEGGGHEDFRFFKGGDFSVTDFGTALGDFRLGITPPPQKFSSWSAEYEFHLLTLKAKPSDIFPFQDPLASSTMRSAFLKNQSFGFEINQYLAFNRTDLEALGLQKLWAVGPLWQWIRETENYVDTYRFGFLFGQSYNIDASIKRTWNWGDPDSHQWILSPEIRFASGMTLNKNYWFEAGSYLWFGIRW